MGGVLWLVGGMAAAVMPERHFFRLLFAFALAYTLALVVLDWVM